MDWKEILASVFGTIIKVIFAVWVVTIVMKYATIAYDYGYRIFGEKPITSGEGRTVEVTIPIGADAKAVGEILKIKGLIRDADLFVIQEKISDYRDSILPGDYELNTSMTAEQMLEIMSTPAEEETEEDNKSLDEMEDANQGEVVVGSENNS